MYTLSDLWKQTYDTYYLTFDNKGNFKEGKGIVLYKIYKEVEKEMKEYATSRRKNDYIVEVLWNKKENQLAKITIKR